MLVQPSMGLQVFQQPTSLPGFEPTHNGALSSKIEILPTGYSSATYWIDKAREKMLEADPFELKIPCKDWPGVVVDHFLGLGGRTSLLQKASGFMKKISAFTTNLLTEEKVERVSTVIVNRYKVEKVKAEPQKSEAGPKARLAMGAYYGGLLWFYTMYNVC